MAKISLRSLTWSDEGRDVVAAPLSVEIEDREFVSIVGPSVREVSRIIRSMAGLERVSSGEILIGEQRVNDIPSNRRDLALVPQGYLSYPRMSLRENLAFALSLRKRPKAEIEKRVSAAAEVAGLQTPLERNGTLLSDVELQRLAIAHAVVINPKAILFDRPLTGLDDRSRRQMRNEIMKLHQRLQITMIYGTCDPIEAISIGGRSIVVRSGVIEQQGTAFSLAEEPANMFVADFIAGMNMIHGSLKQERGDSWIFSERDPGTIKLRLSASEVPAGEKFGPGPILLGIRPEEIGLAQPSNAPGKGAEGFPAIVDRVELSGSGVELYLATGSHTVISCIQRGANTPEAGHRSRFQINLSRVRLFDPSTGLRIV